MEFFIPSLFVLLFSVVLVFLIIPKFGPTTLIVISIILLAFGIYHHSTLFKDDYATSTWNNLLIAYGPYVMMLVLFIFILFYVFSSYGGGAVPVPSMPSVNVSPASMMNTIGSAVTSAANTIKNSISNTGTPNSRNKIGKSFFDVI